MSLEQSLPAVNWTEAERRAWAWPKALKPSEWAERYRILPAHVSAEPGPWRGERTPYLTGIIDSLQEPGIEGIVVCKAAQVGFSEMVRNALGFFIDHEPGPTLFVMPDQKSAEDLMEERLKPLLEFTPAVERHVTNRAWDVKKTTIRLDSMSVYMAWSGSSVGMKSRPIRYLFLEEPDDYAKMTGAAGDPISKGLKRITTYSAKGKARVILGGTPTVRSNNVMQWFERCGERRYFWIPCPHCQGYQRLVWGDTGAGPGVKWPKRNEGETNSRYAARIEAEDLAYYRCEHCLKRITHAQKIDVLRRGMWANEDQVVIDGHISGPASKHPKWVAFHLSALYSPWVRFSQMVGEWIMAQDNRLALEDFLNQRLAEPFEEIVSSSDAPQIIEKGKLGGLPRIIPQWCQLLVATADTQKDWFALCIRAWGWDYRSKLIYYGTVQTFDELYRSALESQFAVEGTQTLIKPFALLIDSGGDRTDEVYQFALRDAGRIFPTKGASWAMRKPWTLSHLPNGVGLRSIDTNFYKDMLTRLIKHEDPAKWTAHNEITEQYALEMTSEIKVVDRKSGKYVWKKLAAGRRNEAWDTETLQCAAADMANLGAIPQQPSAPKPAESSFNPLSYGGKW